MTLKIGLCGFAKPQGVVFASFRGHDSVLRHRPAVATCVTGGHAIWWLVEAEGTQEALALLPHYVAEPPCPKASLALLGALEDAVRVPLPQGDLEELAEAWQRGAVELAESDPEIAEYVSELESERSTAELPEASGDAIAREFERYLRRRGNSAE